MVLHSMFVYLGKPEDKKSSCVYQIKHKNEELNQTYIGQTINLQHRIAHHNGTCNNPNDKHHNVKLYDVIRAMGGTHNYEISILYKSDDIDLIKEMEAIIIKRIKPSLNTNIPMRTKKEYEEANKEQIKCRRMKHLYLNHEEIKKRDNARNAFRKDYLVNKSKEYYAEHKEELLKKRKVNVSCVCGKTMRSSNFKDHLKTKIHTELLEKTNSELKNLRENILRL